MTDMGYLEFRCPECGMAMLTEVYTNCTTEYEIAMKEDGEMEYYETNSYHGDFIGFECKCGYHIPIDVKDMTYDEACGELRAWLLSRPPNIDKVLENL